MRRFRLERNTVHRIVTAGGAVVLAFATGFILQESDILGKSPSIPGRVPLDAVATGEADAVFTSGTIVIAR